MAQPTRATPLAHLDVDPLRRALLAISADLDAGLPGQRVDALPEAHAEFLRALRHVLAEEPRRAWPRLAVSFNADQVDSKLWLLSQWPEAADLSAKRLVILGAWYGLLAMLVERLVPRPPAEMLCIDLDDETCARAERLLAILRAPVAVRQADMLTLDHEALAAGRPTVFLNTSCEHLSDFAAWRDRLPAGSRVVLQSNDHTGCPEHVGCVPNLAAFEDQARLSRVDYRGTLALARFNRFMLIGAT